MLSAEKGIVRLLTREELPEKVDTREESIWLLCQQLTRAMETGGVEACAQIVAPMLGSNAERAKDLAYRLYTLAERKGWTQELRLPTTLLWWHGGRSSPVPQSCSRQRRSRPLSFDAIPGGTRQ